jgi:hypothetical protein
MFRKNTRFVEYENLVSGKTDNMPESDWNDIQRNPYRRKDFKFVRIIDVGGPASNTSGGERPPIEEDPLECPLCGYVAEDDKDLHTHKEKKH